MTVWIVSRVVFMDGQGIYGVYDTRELAERVIAWQETVDGSNSDHVWYVVHEYTVQSEAPL